MLPSSIKVSRRAESKLKVLSGATKLNRNALARIAIMLAVKENSNLSNAGVSDFQGQEFSKQLLFGDYEKLYDVIINQYIHRHRIEKSVKNVIVDMIEVGVFKLGHVKNLQGLSSIFCTEPE